MWNKLLGELFLLGMKMNKLFMKIYESLDIYWDGTTCR